MGYCDRSKKSDGFPPLREVGSLVSFCRLCPICANVDPDTHYLGGDLGA